MMRNYKDLEEKMFAKENEVENNDDEISVKQELFIYGKIAFFNFSKRKIW